MAAVPDGPTVSGLSTWTCRGDRQLPAAVLLAARLGPEDQPPPHGKKRAPRAWSPCVRRHSPRPSSCSLMVTSEARTIEVYSRTGDYCGTGRGERDDGIQTDGDEDRGPFYKTHLILESPCDSCEVKFLSLGGRSRVAVSRILVGLQPLGPSSSADRGPAPGLGLGLAPSIDMQRVQTLVEEMGSSLSPGAQSLMEMVNVQQKNQASALGGLLPLLMGGGAFSALARGSAGPLATVPNGPLPPASVEVQLCPPRTVLWGQMKLPLHRPGHSAQKPIDRAQLAEMMSHFLNGQAPGQGGGGGDGGGGPDLGSATAHFLPMLQSVCGQVTQLRLDNAAVEKNANGAWALDEAMERRLEDMERRLKEHMDRRLDALELKLERVLLLAALPGVAALGQGAGPAEAGVGTEGGTPSSGALHAAS
ncbi:hypothetical protein N1851_034867 [Merluccius polli]|uniref:Uncharacterized protein n=1 Tax=Merluccius polli TaxID=89951 RepID=A0AA47NNB6_MERPO|nr:hypothetical protein N1851_034867 [Merluccius polli]